MPTNVPSKFSLMIIHGHLWSFLLIKQEQNIIILLFKNLAITNKTFTFALKFNFL